MKKEKTILLGEEFRENKKMQQGYYTEFLELEECYKRCSYRKQYIYNYYLDLLQKNCDSVLNYGVRSYNSSIITLHAKVRKNNKLFYLVITPANNWYMEV